MRHVISYWFAWQVESEKFKHSAQDGLIINNNKNE